MVQGLDINDAQSAGATLEAPGVVKRDDVRGCPKFQLCGK